MALDTYTNLKAAIADVANRTDLTSEIVDCITLAEAEMQADCKLLEAGTTASVTITAGVGTLPTGYVAMRSVYWVGSPNRDIRYIPPDLFDSYRVNDTGDGYYYTIIGNSIYTTPMGSGSVVCTYIARFTALSAGNATNAILTNFPNAYLYGALKHLAIVTDDDAKLQKFGILFNAEKERIDKNNEQRKYGGVLQVRTR